MKSIQHIWFDMVGTLDVHTPEFHEAHNQLLYETYAEATGQPLSTGLAEEYETLYKKAGTHSAAFASLGLPSDY